MSKEGTLIVVGLLIALSPFSGLPHAWLAWILPVLGAITLLVGYAIRKSIVAARAGTSAPRDMNYEAPTETT